MTIPYAAPEFFSRAFLGRAVATENDKASVTGSQGTSNTPGRLPNELHCPILTPALVGRRVLLWSVAV